MICNQSEQRHKAGADVGGCHLNTNDSLRLIRAEMLRSRVHDARVNRCAAKSGQDKSDWSADASKRKKQCNQPKQNDAFAQSNHLSVVEFHGQKSA